MPEEAFAAAVEAPEIGGATEPAEHDTGGGESPAAEQDSAEPSTEGVDDAPPPAGLPSKPIVDGKLSAEYKAALDKLKAENPALAEGIRKALFEQARIQAALPGGLNEVKQLRQRIEQLGGDQGIQESQQELDGWRQFDQQFTSADPKVLDFLMETPAGKDAFIKIAPLTFDRYAEAHPEGYSSYIANAFMADMQAANLPLLIERLGDFLPADNPKVVELYGKLSQYVNRIGDLARKQVTAPKSAAAPAADDGRAKFEQEKQQFQRKQWATETGTKHTGLFREAWAKHVGERKLTQGQTQTLRDLYGVRLQGLLAKKADFNPTLERYFTSGQKDGFIRHFESVYKEAVPLALRTAMAELGIGKPGPKPGAPPPAGKQGPPAARQPAGKLAAGFVKVANKPNMQTEVNRAATSPQMWAARQAILKTGQKVTW